MAGKIWHFDILVDDCFVNFNPDRANITPDTNDFLLSIVNGFEDGNWMKKNGSPEKVCGLSIQSC